MTDRVICCPHCGHEFRFEDEPRQRFSLGDMLRELEDAETDARLRAGFRELQAAVNDKAGG